MRIMKHKQVFSIYLREARREGGAIVDDWYEWRNEWQEETGIRRCDSCGIYGTEDEFVFYHNVEEPNAAGDGYFCRNCAKPQGE